MFRLILVFISFLLGLWCIRRLRRYDVHEAEPFGKMLGVTLWGGAASIVLSLFLYSVLNSSGISIRDGFPFSHFFVGFIEELAKLAALVLCWGLIRKEMDEPTDGLIYMACVALGFSLIENYFYATRGPASSPLVAIRLIICTPMHIAFSIFMGLAFYRAVRHEAGWGLLLRAFLFAGIYHALYNIFVGWWYLLPGLYFILKSAYRWMHRLLGYTAATSPFRKSLAEFIHTCPAPPVEAGVECLECGNGAPRPTYRNGRIRIQRCEACGAMVCSRKSLFQLFRQYGSTFTGLEKLEYRVHRQNGKLRVLVAGNRIDRKKGIACFQLDELNGVLEGMSRKVAQRATGRWWNKRCS